MVGLHYYDEKRTSHYCCNNIARNREHLNKTYLPYKDPHCVKDLNTYKHTKVPEYLQAC